MTRYSGVGGYGVIVLPLRVLNAKCSDRNQLWGIYAGL